MRASRVLAVRPERAYLALAELCEERKEMEEFTPSGLFIPPRLSFPPQIPYTIGSSSFRPNGSVQRDRLSPPRPGPSILPTALPTEVPSNEPPVHMAPKRSKWTSPPPEEAPDADRSSYESRLGLGLTLATTSTDAREREREQAYLSSSNNSEIMSDDGDTTSEVAPEEDDVRSVRSFAGEPSFAPQFMYVQRGVPFIPHRLSDVASPVYGVPNQFHARGRAVDDSTPTPSHNHRGRKGSRMSTEFVQPMPPVSYPRFGLEKRFSMGNKSDMSRRSVSGAPRQSVANRSSLSPLIPTPQHVPLPPSPVTGSPVQFMPSSPVIVYETSPRTRGSRPTSLYSAPHSPLMTGIIPHPHFSPDFSDLPMQLAGSKRTSPIDRRPSKLGNVSATSSSNLRAMHSHTLSNSTIIAPVTPSATSSFQATSSSQQSSPSCSPLRTALPLLRPNLPPSLGRRPSLSQGTSPVATSSIGTPSPPSSNSSRSCSVGSLSPVSSISPQTVSLASPNASQQTESTRLEQFERIRRAHETRSSAKSSPRTPPTSATLSTSQEYPNVESTYEEESDIVRKTELVILVTLDKA